jgi:hypothetical protein
MKLEHCFKSFWQRWTIQAAAPEFFDNLSLPPARSPFGTRAGMLKVSDIHTLHYEQSGKPDGNPVVVLHGTSGTRSHRLVEAKVSLCV